MKRYRCFKGSVECSIHYSRDDHNCGNLSELAIRIEEVLVDRPEKQARDDMLERKHTKI